MSIHNAVLASLLALLVGGPDEAPKQKPTPAPKVGQQKPTTIPTAAEVLPPAAEQIAALITRTPRPARAVHPVHLAARPEHTSRAGRLRLFNRNRQGRCRGGRCRR